MKSKTFLVLTFLFAYAVCTYAQIYTGLRLGMNSTWLYGDDVVLEDRKAQLGPLAGIIIRTSGKTLAAQMNCFILLKE